MTVKLACAVLSLDGVAEAWELLAIDAELAALLPSFAAAGAVDPCAGASLAADAGVAVFRTTLLLAEPVLAASLVSSATVGSASLSVVAA